MALKRLYTSLTRRPSKPFDESRFGERPELTFVLVGKEMIVLGRAIDLLMILQRFVRVSGARMRAPEDVLTLQRGCLSVRQV